MRLSTILTVFAATITAAPAFTAAAQDAAAPECGSFTLTADLVSRHFHDAGDEGSSPGDKRLTHFDLTNKAGEKVGVLYIVATVLPGSDGDRFTAVATLHAEFSNGALVYQGVGSTPNPADTARTVDHEIRYAVLGGSGDFAHATGSVTGRPIENDPGGRQYTFDLMCHG